MWDFVGCMLRLSSAIRKSLVFSRTSRTPSEAWEFKGTETKLGGFRFVLSLVFSNGVKIAVSWHMVPLDSDVWRRAWGSVRLLENSKGSPSVEAVDLEVSVSASGRGKRRYSREQTVFYIPTFISLAFAGPFRQSRSTWIHACRKSARVKTKGPRSNGGSQYRFNKNSICVRVWYLVTDKRWF